MLRRRSPQRCGIEHKRELFAHLLLPHEVGKLTGPQGTLCCAVKGAGFRTDDPLESLACLSSLAAHPGMFNHERPPS